MVSDLDFLLDSDMSETETEKKRKLRFSCFDDINLLKLAVGLNPYGNNKNWRTVHLNFIKTANKPFTLRAVKDHVEHLLMLYKKKDLGTLRRGKAGTEKLHKEKEQLLKELFSVKESFILNKKKKRELKSNNSSNTVPQLAKAKGEVLHASTEDPELTNPDPPPTPSIPPTPFSPNISENTQAGSFCEFMRILPKFAASTSRDVNPTPTLEILDDERGKELEFEKRKLSLEEKKIELENRRLALEEAKLQYFLESQKQQHQLMLVLIQKITNTNK